MPGLTIFQMNLRYTRITTPVYEESQLTEEFTLNDEQRAEIEQIRKQDVKERILDYKRARIAVNRARETSTTTELYPIIEEPILESVVAETMPQP